MRPRQFSAIISKYRKDKDDEDLFKTLTKIFLYRSTALSHLFRGRLFISFYYLKLMLVLDYRQFVNK